MVKKAIKLNVDAIVLDRARRLNLNLSQVFEAALAVAIRRGGRDEWLQRNRVALRACNEHVQKHGVFGECASRKSGPAQPDYIGMACTSAGVSLRKPLAADELVRALMVGKAPRGKRAHFIVLLEEAPAPLLRGLVTQVSAWAAPGAVARNIRRIAAEIGVALKTID
jgi:antitoxin CcdA